MVAELAAEHILTNRALVPLEPVHLAPPKLGPSKNNPDMLVDYHQLSAEKDALRHLLPDIYQETSEHEKILNFASHHTADGLLAFDNGQPVAFLLLQRAGDSADIIDIGTARQFCGVVLRHLLQHYLGHMPA